MPFLTHKKFLGLSSFQLIIVVIFLLSLLKSFYFSFFGLNIVDEGDRLYNGLRILQGQIIYKDFSAFFPPLNDYFYALSFLVFGKSILIPRLLTNLIFSLFPVAVFLIAHKLMPVKFALLPALLANLLSINMGRFYFFTTIYFAIYISMIALEKERKYLFFFTGFLLGITSLIRFDIPGTYLIGLIIGLCLHLYIKNCISFIKEGSIFFAYLISGYLIPILLVLLWILRSGILDSFFQQTVIYPMIIASLHSLPFYFIIDILPQNLSLKEMDRSYTILFGNTILVVYLLTFIHIVRNLKRILLDKPFIAIFLISGILSLPYFFGRSDVGHMTKAGMSFLILGTYLFYRLSKTKIIGMKWIVGCFVVVLFIANIIQSAWWIRFNDQDIVLGNYKISLNSKFIPGSTIPSANTLKDSVEFLRSRSTEDEAVLVLPYMPVLYFLADRKNPTKYNNAWNGVILTKEAELDFIQRIDDQKVNLVIYDPTNGPEMKVKLFKDYNPLIHTFLMTNFNVIKLTPEGWLFMERKS